MCRTVRDKLEQKPQAFHNGTKSAALVAACEAMGERCIWWAWLTGPYGWEAGKQKPLKHCQVMATLKPCSPANSYCLLDLGQHTFESQRETDCCHWIHATSTLLYTRWGFRPFGLPHCIARISAFADLWAIARGERRPSITHVCYQHFSRPSRSTLEIRCSWAVRFKVWWNYRFQRYVTLNHHPSSSFKNGPRFMDEIWWNVSKLKLCFGCDKACLGRALWPHCPDSNSSHTCRS